MSSIQQPLAWPAIQAALSVQRYFTPADLGMNNVPILAAASIQSGYMDCEGMLQSTLYCVENGGTQDLSALQFIVAAVNENDEPGVVGLMSQTIVQNNGGSAVPTGTYIAIRFANARDPTTGAGAGVLRKAFLIVNNTNLVNDVNNFTCRWFLRGAPFALPQRGA